MFTAKNITHVIFDLDGLLIGKAYSICPNLILFVVIKLSACSLFVHSAFLHPVHLLAFTNRIVSH